MKFINLIQLLILMICRTYAQDIIAYDCEDPNVQISRISLRGVKPCIDLRNSTKIENRKYITLVQKRQYFQVHVYTCLVKVQQIVQHCGAFSHTSAVDEGFSTFIHKIYGEECKDIHLTKYINLSNLKNGLLMKVQLNSTTQTSATIKGKLEHDGSCKGEKYFYNGIEYKDVIVTTDITIKLRDYDAIADIEENSLRLKTGNVCSYSTHYCFDDEAGEVTWDIRDHSNICSKNNFDILYEGVAKLITFNENNSKYIVVDANNTIFALKLQNEENICSNSVWRTELSRLGVIFRSYSSNSNVKSQQMIAHNIDMMNQILTKLLHLEIAIKTQHLETIYESIKKRCQLRENMLKNRLALAYSSPDIVSDLVKEGSGHIGRIMGEVLYIVQCVPTIAELRQTNECYQEVPITYKKKNHFMTPINHIIQDHGTQIDCDTNMPSMVLINKTWLQFDPYKRHGYPIPFTLNANDPSEKIPTLSISSLDSNGIYSKKEMENFRQTLLFPNERKTISNIVARRITGAEAESQGFRFPNLFSKIEFVAIAKSVSKFIWGAFSGIVSYFPAIIVFIIGLCLFKYIIGVIFNCFILKNVSSPNPLTRIVGSLWNSLTRLILFRSSNKKNQEEKNTKDIDTSNKQAESLITNVV